MNMPQRLVWDQPGWPQFTYDQRVVSTLLADARHSQGLAEGRLAAIGMAERTEILADAWAQEAMATAKIEGEYLDLNSVRSSIARRLGTGGARSGVTARDVEGLLDVMDSAIRSAKDALSEDQLKAWQLKLFPGGSQASFSLIRPVLAGEYRTAPMQIVSGSVGHETVHYIAPPHERVPSEMRTFVAWVNQGSATPTIVKAAIAHLWFETIHPFDDGNGRIGRALIDRIIAGEVGEFARLVRISEQLLERRDEYYKQLEFAQHGDLDITPWVGWFVEQFRDACMSTVAIVDTAVVKATYRARHANKSLNDRQRKFVDKMLELGPAGFPDGLKSSKYESMTGAARATAYRDLADLVQMGMLSSEGALKGTRYFMTIDGWGRPSVSVPE